VAEDLGVFLVGFRNGWVHTGGGFRHRHARLQRHRPRIGHDIRLRQHDMRHMFRLLRRGIGTVLVPILRLSVLLRPLGIPIILRRLVRRLVDHIVADAYHRALDRAEPRKIERADFYLRLLG
jgi:hypothetical protein